MVVEVSPGYYATGEQSPFEFVVKGYNLDALPQNAVAIMSSRNDDPLQYRYSGGNYDMEIISQAKRQVIFRSHYEGTYGTPKYLGAILTADLETILWVNESRPLPSQ